MTGPHRCAEYEEDGYLWFFCPGCETHHRIKIGPWTYNGDPIRPTFNPSVMVSYGGSDGNKVCHFFVKDGRIQYLMDSYHKYKGQTIDMPMLDDEASPKSVA